MDMTEVKAFEQPTEDLTKVKPSEWLRRGIPSVRNYRDGYFVSCAGIPNGCALGTAAYAKTQATGGTGLRWPVGLTDMTEILGLPYRVALDVSSAHYSGRATREQCVALLEDAGY